MSSLTYPSVDPYESASDIPSTSTDTNSLPNCTNREGNDCIEICDIEDPLLSDTVLDDLLAEAWTKLIKDGSLNRRGVLAGIKGTYSATKINRKPSHTTEWRRRKNALEVKDFISNAEAQHKLNGSPVLLEHFFNRQYCESTEELFESEGNIVSCWVLVPDSDSDGKTETETDIGDKEADGPIRETSKDARSVSMVIPTPDRNADKIHLPQTILAVNKCSRLFVPSPTDETVNCTL